MQEKLKNNNNNKRRNPKKNPKVVASATSPTLIVNKNLQEKEWRRNS